jgi:hypothetical protein
MSSTASKIAAIVRSSVERARAEFAMAGDSFKVNFTHQDAAVLNILRGMVGFRNIAVHQYKDLDLDVVEDVIRNRLDDLLLFVETIRTHLADDS